MARRRSATPTSQWCGAPSRRYRVFCWTDSADDASSIVKCWPRAVRERQAPLDASVGLLTLRRLPTRYERERAARPRPFTCPLPAGPNILMIHAADFGPRVRSRVERGQRWEGRQRPDGRWRARCASRYWWDVPTRSANPRTPQVLRRQHRRPHQPPPLRSRPRTRFSGATP